MRHVSARGTSESIYRRLLVHEGVVVLEHALGAEALLGHQDALFHHADPFFGFVVVGGQKAGGDECKTLNRDQQYHWYGFRKLGADGRRNR